MCWPATFDPFWDMIVSLKHFTTFCGTKASASYSYSFPLKSSTARLERTLGFSWFLVICYLEQKKYSGKGAITKLRNVVMMEKK